MEKPAWQLEPGASQQSRTRPRLCKHCAASIRRRSYASSFRVSKSDLPHQNGEARIGSKAYRFRFLTKPCQGVGAFLIGFLEPLEPLVLISESGVNIDASRARNVTMLLHFIE